MTPTGWLVSGLTLLSLCRNVFSAPEFPFYFGRVQGVDKQAEGTGRQYSAYYGIPYAQPPVGENRFKAPQQLLPNVNQVVTTNAVRTACYQTTFLNQLQVSEDCLYLNVYVPIGASTSNLKKVMVFIHGGGFLAGDTYKYTPSGLVSQGDVIVVTLNYRLGVFGFLSSGRKDGNYGLLDQVAALRWVKDHIHDFGGDRNDVTVFGNSAGALSASLLAISPNAKGLFNKVILQSSTALNARSVKDDPAAQFDKLARAAGCTPWFFSRWLRHLFMDRIMDCLRRMKTEELYGLSVSLGVDFQRQQQRTPRYGEGFGEDSDRRYTPVVDEVVIPRHPAILMSDRRYLQEVGALDRSYIVGINNNEALLFAEMFFRLGGNVTSINTVETAEALLYDVLKDKFTLGVPAKVKAVTNYEYLWPRTDGRPPLQGVLDMHADYTFNIPSVKFVRKLLDAHNQTKVFYYLFDHEPRVTNPSLGISGSSHAMEVAYLFDNDAWTRQYNYYTTVPDPGRSDAALFEVMQGAWSQFAKTGSPAGYLSGRASPWPAYDRQNEEFLAISVQPQVKARMYAKRVALWLDFWYTQDSPVNRRRYG